MHRLWLLLIIVLVVAGCATTPTRPVTDPAMRGAAVAEAIRSEADECRVLSGDRPIVPATAAPRIGLPWWWSAPASADPSRAVLKDGLRPTSACPLEE